METVIKIKSNDISGNGKIKITAEKKIERVVFIIKELSSAREFKFEYAAGANIFEGEFFIKNPLLWSVSAPNLYEFNAEIFYGESSETLNGKFGFRNISTNGKEICINGTPLFVRGFIRGAKAHDHADNCNLSEEDFYRKNIRAAKKYGFNFVRFHSVVPSETFFKVADEEGILVHIELRMPEDIYNNLREMPSSGNILVTDEYVLSVVNGLYNHPSLCVYCIGNEIKNIASDGRVKELYTLIKDSDDTRLFLDTCAWGENNRPLVDIDVQHMSYYFPFNSHADMYENTENLLVVGSNESKPLKATGKNSSVCRELFYNVPLIAHEVCHYTALRDYEELNKKFKQYGRVKPWWIDEEIKMIKAKGYEKVYPEMYRASKYFQFICWKTAFEEMRRSRLLGGFHFLQFADTDVYENSNGIVDCFDDETCVDNGEFLRFNGDRVILADLRNRLFSAGEEIFVNIDFSNCGEDKEEFADLNYTLIGKGGKVYASGTLKNADISRKGTYRLCRIRIKLPQVKSSEEFAFKVSLDIGKNKFAENEWNIWVYDTSNKISYEEFLNFEEENAVITDDFKKAFESLNKGKNVCLVYRSDFTRHVANKDMKNPEYAFKASWNRFKPVIWDRGTNYGGILNEELFNGYGFATGKYYDFNLSLLSEDCDKINLDDFPVKAENLISGIDKSVRDRFDAYKDCFNLPELMYDRTLRNFSYMFQVAAGKGKLLVCGLNFTGLDKGEPSTVCMANFIINYIKSKDFRPKNSITVKDLKSYTEECAKKPVKERMMTQFWELDDAPVESKQFWKESKEYLKND